MDLSSKKLMLVQSKTGEMVEIPKLTPKEAYRTLRAWIAAVGNQQKQLKALQEKVALWLDCIEKSSLSSHDKQITYSAFLQPHIIYLLGCTTIDGKALKQLFRPVLDMILHTLGLNNHFPLSLVHAGNESWTGH